MTLTELLCACSIYVAGVDIVQVNLTMGSTFVSINSQDIVPLVAGQEQPGVGNVWFDIGVSLFATKLNTANMQLPGLPLPLL